MTINDWINESENLIRYLEKEGMDSNIGMPFTQMIVLIKAAQNHMKVQKNLGRGQNEIDIEKNMVNKRIKATIDYLDSKDNNEHK